MRVKNEVPAAKVGLSSPILNSKRSIGQRNFARKISGSMRLQIIGNFQQKHSGQQMQEHERNQYVGAVCFCFVCKNEKCNHTSLVCHISGMIRRCSFFVHLYPQNTKISEKSKTTTLLLHSPSRVTHELPISAFDCLPDLRGCSATAWNKVCCYGRT